MKIQRVHMYGVNPYRVQERQQAEVHSNRSFQDRLEISRRAQQMSGKSSFEAVRQEKVKQLKQQVEEGTYEVNSRELAANLIRHFRL